MTWTTDRAAFIETSSTHYGQCCAIIKKNNLKKSEIKEAVKYFCIRWLTALELSLP